MSKKLTKKTALWRAHALWGASGDQAGNQYGDRVGTVYCGRKTTPKRFRVGYYTRTPIVWTKNEMISVDTDPVTWMGSSDLSWEDAFADAERWAGANKETCLPAEDAEEESRG